MANTVEGSVQVNVGLALAPVGDASWKVRRLAAQLALAFAFTGSGGLAGAAEQIYATQQSILTGNNFDIDMASALENDIGEALAFNDAKFIIVYNRSTTGSITLTSSGPATAHVAALNGTVTIRPGGVFVLGCNNATGYTVAAGATDTLRISNASGVTVTVDIIVVGNV
jgi:hypothetical protein